MDAYAYRNEHTYDSAWVLISANLLRGYRLQLVRSEKLRVVPNVGKKKVQFQGSTVTSLSALYLTIEPKELPQQSQMLLDTEVHAVFGDDVVTTSKLNSGIFVYNMPKTTYTGKVFGCSKTVETTALVFTNKRDLKKSLKDLLGSHTADVRDRDEILKRLIALMSL